MKSVYILPFPGTIEKRIARPTGDFAHENFPESRYTIDFLLDPGTSILAARGGKVVKIEQDSDNVHFDPKDLQGKSMDEILELASKHTNFIAIRHSDGTFAEYLHLGKNGVVVKECQEVNQGDLLGYTGMSGVMDRPHLHFNVFRIDGRKAISIPVDFEN